MKNHPIWLATVLAAGGLAMGGCATHQYVDRSIAEHNAQNQEQFASVSADAQAALARANAAHKLAEENFQHAILFTDDTAKFNTDSSALSADTQASLIAFANRIKSDNKNVYIEVQGHTDATGSEASNHQLGHLRANAVADFLVTKGIPPYHLDATSYGEDYASGPAHPQDRRVVLVVMN